jgi:hypothetical protein
MTGETGPTGAQGLPGPLVTVFPIINNMNQYISITPGESADIPLTDNFNNNFIDINSTLFSSTNQYSSPFTGGYLTVTNYTSLYVLTVVNNTLDTVYVVDAGAGGGYLSLVGQPGPTGSVAASSTNTTVQYNSGGSLAGSTGLVFDYTNTRLGVNIPTPAYTLDINGAANFSGTGTFQSSLSVLGNLNLGSSLFTSYTPATTSATNVTVNSASGNYLNLGGLLSTWGTITVTWSTTTATATITGITYPSSFFKNSIQSNNISVQSTTDVVVSNITAITGTTSFNVTLYRPSTTTSSTTTTLAFFALGT